MIKVRDTEGKSCGVCRQEGVKGGISGAWHQLGHETTVRS